MKAKYIFLLAIAGFFVPALTTASSSLFVQDYERKLSETFSITSDGRVHLENRYGKIRVETWERNDVKIDVVIRVGASNQSDADEVFNRISVDLSGSTSNVSAITDITSKSRGKSWWNMITGSGSSSSDFKIYYTVRMPASVELEVDARYCDVELPTLTGETRLTVRYGDLVAGRLTNRNELDVSYGSARVEEMGKTSRVRLRYGEAVIRKAADMRYDGRYSESRIESVGKLTIDAGYEEIEIGAADEIRVEGSYNEIDIESVNRLYIDGNYSDYVIGTVAKEIELDANYGDFTVNRLVAGFERVYIRTTYIDVDIDVDSGAGYELDLSARYGDIDTDTDSLSPRNVSKESQTRIVTGKKAGRGNGKVDISTSYGDIEFD